MREFMFRGGDAWLFSLHVFCACGNAGSIGVAAARRYLAEFAFGIENSGTDQDRTIHAFA